MRNLVFNRGNNFDIESVESKLKRIVSCKLLKKKKTHEFRI